MLVHSHTTNIYVTHCNESAVNVEAQQSLQRCIWWGPRFQLFHQVWPTSASVTYNIIFDRLKCICGRGILFWAKLCQIYFYVCAFNDIFLDISIQNSHEKSWSLKILLFPSCTSEGLLQKCLSAEETMHILQRNDGQVAAEINYVYSPEPSFSLSFLSTPPLTSPSRRMCGQGDQHRTSLPLLCICPWVCLGHQHLRKSSRAPWYDRLRSCACQCTQEFVPSQGFGNHFSKHCHLHDWILKMR